MGKGFEKKQLDNIRYYCLILSENYIRNHFSEIKKFANIIEKRLEDDSCTLENVLKDNKNVLKQAIEHKVNYILIDDKYEFDIDIEK